MNERNGITLFDAFDLSEMRRNALEFAVNELSQRKESIVTFDGKELKCDIAKVLNKDYCGLTVDNFDWDQTTFTHDDGDTVRTYNLADCILEWHDMSRVSLECIIPLYYHFEKLGHLVSLLYKSYGAICMDVLAELVQACIPNNCISTISAGDNDILICVYKKLSPAEKERISPENETPLFPTIRIVHSFSARDLLVPPQNAILDCIYVRAHDVVSGRVWREKVNLQKEDLYEFELWYNRKYHIFELCTQEDGMHFMHDICEGYAQDIPYGMRRVKVANFQKPYYSFRFR